MAAHAAAKTPIPSRKIRLSFFCLVNLRFQMIVAGSIARVRSTIAKKPRIISGAKSDELGGTLTSRDNVEYIERFAIPTFTGL